MHAYAQAVTVGALGFIVALGTGIIGKDASPLADKILESVNKFDRKEAEKVIYMDTSICTYTCT
jgi:hypothetical protein